MDYYPEPYGEHYAVEDEAGRTSHQGQEKAKVTGEMVYDWEGKETTCYEMYITQNKSLEEIMELFKVEYNFAPSKRAFQTQIKKWGFPSKHHPAQKDEVLKRRVNELWANNVSQKEMLVVLKGEGYNIKERELTRLRQGNKLRLRVANGQKFYSANADNGNQNVNVDGSPEVANNQTTSIGSRKRAASTELSPQVLAKRQAHKDKLYAESASRYELKTRRRRTKGWAGLPADPPGPPRFPSETTIEESKALLRLNGNDYRRMREHFQHICEDNGVVKKTEAGAEQWQAIKDQLVRENVQLQAVFWAEPADHSQELLALDVICSDVTKRIRTLKSRVTIAQAKNAMGINPDDSRQLRAAFYDILQEDHFTSKLEAGDEHWKELKAKWVADSPLLQQILGPGAADPDHADKAKAAEVLCRDVMKRHRDDQTKRDPSRKKQTKGTVNNNTSKGIATLASQALASAHSTESATAVQPDYDGQIDPELLYAANAPSFEMSLHQNDTHHLQQAMDHHQIGDPQNTFHNSQSLHPILHPIPVYFRLSRFSHIQLEPKVWLGTLPGLPSVQTLRMLALSKHGYHPDQIGIAKIEGVVTSVAAGNNTSLGQDQEMMYPIDMDDELIAYLHHVKGEKATFVVQLVKMGMA